MSQGDVEIVKEFTRRFAAGDDVIVDHFDSEIVWDTSASGLPSAGVYRGREGVRRFFCIDAGGAVVLVFRQAGTGRESGVRIESDFFAVYELESTKVVRFRLFASREQAFEAAGIPESGLGE